VQEVETLEIYNEEEGERTNGKIEHVNGSRRKNLERKNRMVTKVKKEHEK